jgi:putative spermidine/putrescine transport system permease protein
LLPNTMKTGKIASSVRTFDVRGPGEQKRRVDATLWLLMPSLLILLLCLGVPLIVVLVSSFQPNDLLPHDAAGLYNYEYLITQHYYIGVLVRTIRLGVLGALITLPLGYAAALALPRLSARVGSAAIMALTLPTLAGPLVIILGWMALLPGHGPLFGPLVRWGLIDPPRIVGSDAAVLVSLVHFLLPFAILTLYASIRQIPRELYEAAESLGAGALHKFCDVTLPLSLPGVLSSTIILFSLGASSYISPHYLGGAADLTLTTLIAEFILATYNAPLAGAAAILLLLVMVGCVAGVILLFRRLIRP